MKRTAPILCLALAGCTQVGPGAKWYAPATWFSHAPANAVDAANQREDEAKRNAIKLAQKSAHETQLALAAATASRPVAVASESAATTVNLLDQAAGPLTSTELAHIRETIAGLLSENAAIREAAERQHKSDTDAIASASDRLAKAQAATDAAESNLRKGFDRENQLANELRAQHAIMWLLGSVALLALVAWVYVRYFLGGIPSALGGVLASLERSHPDFTGTPESPGPLRIALDQLMNRHEQSLIRSEYIKTR